MTTTTAKPIAVGDEMNCIMLDKPGGKRNGETRRVKVLQVLPHFNNKLGIKSVQVVTLDNEILPVRRTCVEPKYLVPIPTTAPGNTTPKPKRRARTTRASRTSLEGKQTNDHL